MRAIKTLGLALCALLFVCQPAKLKAQEGGWNSARALELMERARERRAQPIADSTLRSYQARAHGRVYFYLDRRNSDHRTLVKTDQIALDVFWAAPDLTKQRIIGMRDESRLPNRMHYHLDHLTVVQNEFGDRIRLGDGDEVSDVPHPAAAGADSIYDVRLSDSLTIQLPGAPEPVRAYEIQVRPKNTNRAAIVGSVFVDRASADIVRMTFTFTPVSYIDRRLDYINISLDNSLWEGRYWLPWEQSVEIRRQIPELDFIAGAVILGRFRVRDYSLNIEIPATTFMGYRVDAESRQTRESFAFPSELYDELKDEGLAPPPEMSELRAEAARLIGAATLSGLPRFRLSFGGASDVFRYDRAEGAFLGAGFSWEPARLFRAELSAGFASGAERPAFGIALRRAFESGSQLSVEARHNDLRDLGVRPGAAGAISTLSSLAWADDYRDPWYASGFRFGARFPVGTGWSVDGGLRSEQHRALSLARSTAPLSAGSTFRAVRPVDEGWLHAVNIALERDAPEPDAAGWGARFSLESGTFAGNAYIRPTLDATWQQTSADLRTHVELRGAAGLAFGLSGGDALPPAAQLSFTLGGRNTLPGYAYRSFSGNMFALADAEISHDIAWPWLRVRAFGAVGATGDSDTRAAADNRIDPRTDWGTSSTDGLRAGMGAGVGILWDVLRLDAARGLSGGEWQVFLSVHPRLWGIL